MTSIVELFQKRETFLVFYNTGVVAELPVAEDETLVLPPTASAPISIGTIIVPRYPRHYITKRAFVKDGDDFSA